MNKNHCRCGNFKTQTAELCIECHKEELSKWKEKEFKEALRELTELLMEKYGYNKKTALMLSRRQIRILDEVGSNIAV